MLAVNGLGGIVSLLLAYLLRRLSNDNRGQKEGERLINFGGYRGGEQHPSQAERQS